MRNLKRALSLALASVMLLGMMVVGTSAANVSDFADADKIVNSEAAAITTGLKLFSGYIGEDGTLTFGPEKEVNRGIMAAIIGKMVNGTTLNFDIFKGNSPFTDTVTFEGGWAEGYANWCYSTGIANGYGNGIYGVADTVTTWQAALMLQRALGYWDKKDTSAITGPAAINELSVMAKAAELGMFGDLELSANQPLTRDNLAVMVYETLWAQMAKYDSGRGVYVKYNDQDVTIGKSTADAFNTLAYTTFGLEIAEGVVVRNSAVDPALAATDSVEAKTTVVFEDGESYDFEYETGLELIGHAVNVYYAVEKKDVNVYAITDQATVAGVITADTYTKMNAAAVAAGFKSKTMPTEAYLNYDLFADVVDLTDAPANTPILLVSNSANKSVDYAIVLAQYLDVIAVDEDINDEPIYSLGYFGDEQICVVGEVEDQDYVIVTYTCFENGEPTYAIAEPATVVASEITNVTGVSIGLNKDYKEVETKVGDFKESHVDGAEALDLITFQAIENDGAAILVIDTFGNLIAVDAEAAADVEFAYVAQFGYKYGNVSNLTDKVVLSAHVYYADGTNEIITVNTKADANTDDAILNVIANGIEENYNTLNDDAYIGLYYLNATKNGTVELIPIAGLEEFLSDEEGAYVSETLASNAELIKGHSTITVSKEAQVTADDGLTMYQNKGTVYFHVAGDYAEDTLTVKAYTGVANLPKTFKNASSIDLEETYVYIPVDAADATDSRAVVKAILIDDNSTVASSSTGITDVVYYNEGDFTIKTGTKGIDLTFYFYNATGAKKSQTYTYEKWADARTVANELPSGYYKFKKLVQPVVSAQSPLTAIVTVDDRSEESNTVSSKTTYYAAGIQTVDSDITDNYEYNLFTMVTEEGFIYTDAKVIDLTGNGINTVKRLYNAVNNDDLTITVSYSYAGASYVCDVIFVVGYELATEDNTQGGNTNAAVESVALAADGTVTVTMSDMVLPSDGETVTVDVEFFADSGDWKYVESVEVTVAQGADEGTANVSLIAGRAYRVTCGAKVSASVVAGTRI